MRSRAQQHQPPSPPGHYKRRLLSGAGGPSPTTASTGSATTSPRQASPRGSINSRRGGPGSSLSLRSSATMTTRPRKKTLFSVVVGGVLGVYLIFTFVLQPVVDVESATVRGHPGQQLLPRGASKQQQHDSNKHSPLMLLRERDAARRKIKESMDRQAKAVQQKQEEEEEDSSDEAQIQRDDEDDEGEEDDDDEEEPENKPEEDDEDEDDEEEAAAGKKPEEEEDDDSEEEEKEDDSGEEKKDKEDDDEDETPPGKQRIKKKEVGAAEVERVERQINKKPAGAKKQGERILPVVAQNAREAPVAGDPLRAIDWPFGQNPIELKPSVEYLGTLIDAGRHYFPMVWLKKVVDRLSDMNYNLIHLRLTDDQTFNVMLKSRPELAYPTAVNNPDRVVYSVEELRDFTAYAKERGIRIMPEVNVPGHAGSWAGIPDMIVHCPQFICSRGYGLPLNVTHRDLDAILTDVIREIVDIFDDPPFLHLGGDEVNMADPCFNEVGSKVFDYPAFELRLKKIIAAAGYPEKQVVRWEMTGQKALDRAGGIEQFWESHPGDRHEASGEFFVSTWMYLDTNLDQDAYEVYTKAIKSFHLKGGKIPKAIIVGTFELSCEFWYDRNVLGRLLSVAIGAANQDFPTGIKAAIPVKKQWRNYCEQLGFGEIICDTDGRPVISTKIYHSKWRQRWEVWKKDICDRLTESKGIRTYKVSPRVENAYLSEGNRYFWKNFPLELPTRDEENKDAGVDAALPRDVQRLLKHRVPHTGVILDAASAMPKIDRLHSIINDYVALMGFNTAQLRLVNNYGFVYESETLEDLGHSLIAGNENPLYSLKPELEKLAQSAKEAGVEIMPEVSVSTDAGGWYRSGLLANCPDFYCTGKGTPTNIDNENLLPVLFAVIGELRQVFTSRYFHLGTDEREASMACFEEAKTTPKFDKFERKLETLMALANLAPDEIVRTENIEGVRYPDRAGAVTQYLAGQALEDVRVGGDELFFLTIDIFHGDGYAIFENTKKAVALQPLGILAELRKLNESKWKSWAIAKRLLAFAMGVSEIGAYWSIYNADTFESYYVPICEALELGPDCSPPGDFRQPITVITESKEFTAKSCEVRTVVKDKRVAKKVKPFYKIKVTAQK